MEQVKAPKKKKKVITIVIDIILWVFLAFSLIMTIIAFTAQASGNGKPTINGVMYMAVKSDSMVGPNGFNKGDLIFSDVVDPLEAEELQVGDVITFWTDLTPDDGIDNKDLNTHRIVSIEHTDDKIKYYTKGDNNAADDAGCRYPNDIVAVWTGKKVPVLGTVLGFMQSKTGFLICVVIPLFLFFIYKLIALVRAIGQIRGKRPTLSAEDEEAIKKRAIEEYLAKQKAEQDKNDEK